MRVGNLKNSENGPKNRYITAGGPRTLGAPHAHTNTVKVYFRVQGLSNMIKKWHSIPV